MPNNQITRIEDLIRFDPRLTQNGRLEVIVKYNGDIRKAESELNIDIEVLNENYAIASLSPNQLPALYAYSEIEYIELPKTLTFSLSSSLNSACVTTVQSSTRFGLRGSGAIVGIIDSGIDYTHPDFRNPDGTSRILFIWDQTRNGNPPPGFLRGVEYNNSQINTALEAQEPLSVIPNLDEIGHGTAVSGIAAGNGRSSDGRQRGVAPEASLIVVKLGQRSFARTTEVMRAIKYILDKAQALNMPVSINLSYGTNNGSHDGNSLFEAYIDDMTQEWKAVIVAATGNEGSAGHHFSDAVAQDEEMTVEFAVSGILQKMYMTFWKNFVDTFIFELISPGGQTTGEILPTERFTNANLSGVNISIFYGLPTNYSEEQEILFLFEGGTQGIQQGIWRLIVRGENVVDGRFDIWLPTIEDITNTTAFSRPSIETTLTLPSTAQNVISVGGYNALINTIADFSGRGYTRRDVFVKPDIVAPAVGILTTRSGGGYDSFTGTSMAAPFVTGAAALMMEWGIVGGNDPFLYGQRVKAFLRKGARRDPSLTYPNPLWGYGTLCLESTMNYLEQYTRGGVLL